MQSELEGGNVDEMTMSPGPQLQQVPVHQQPGVVGISGRTVAMSAPIDQSKISVFQSALSSPNRRCLPAFAMAPVGYASVQPVRRCVEQPGSDLREDQLESAPYQDSTATGFGFHPSQHHQHQNQHQQHHSQHIRDGAHTFHENDSIMDMHADGVADDYFR